MIGAILTILFILWLGGIIGGTYFPPTKYKE